MVSQAHYCNQEKNPPMACTAPEDGLASMALSSTLPHGLLGHMRRQGLAHSIPRSCHPDTGLRAAIFATRLKCPSPAPQLCQPLVPHLWDPEARQRHNGQQQPATEVLFPEQTQTCLCGSVNLLCGIPPCFLYTL